jgi:DNA (cytosine-5)-methyltransferase 1
MEGHARPPVVAADAASAWRAAVVRELRRQGAPPWQARARVAALEKVLREIAHRLHSVYGSPHLGNLADPTDELVFIVLSRKSPERVYSPAFEYLKKLGGWSHVLELGTRRVEEAIRGGGLERKKARAIICGLQAIEDRFGRVDLSLAAGIDDGALFDFLATLPEVGPKSARCVMLYSFGRPVFPVDAHVGRVLARLGCMLKLGIDLSPMGHKERQRALKETIPPDLRYGLHVNLVCHGRTVCKALRPSCSECMLASRCRYALARHRKTRGSVPNKTHNSGWWL